MVRETRHLWVGNLPDNIREDRIREHFTRYGPVQSVKLLPGCTEDEKTGEITMACTVAFMDIKSASKAHNSDLKIDDRPLTTQYYEPAAIPSASNSTPAASNASSSSSSSTTAASASPQNATASATASPYAASPAASRFPNGHGSSDEHGPASFSERFYERSSSRSTSSVSTPASDDFRRTASSAGGGGGLTASSTGGGYHRSGGRDRGSASYRNGPYASAAAVSERHSSRGGGATSAGGPSAGGGGTAGATAGSSSSWGYENNRYNSTGQTDTGYIKTPSTNSERRHSEQNSKKKTISRAGTRSPSLAGSTSSRSPSRSRSRSSSSSSSSSSPDTSSSGSPKCRRSATTNHSQPAVHSDDRRPLAVCVRNLPVRSSDTSLKDGLYHEYKKHGKVTWVKVVGQDAERYAIVCFKKPEDVEKALEVSYDKLFFGCKIEVAPYQGYEIDDSDLRPYEAEIDEFHPKATRTLFIGNLEKDVTASDLRKHFDQFGEIIEIDIKKQGAVSSYAFCQYSDIVSVVKAIRKMDGEHLGNNRIKLGFGKSMPYNWVWIDGVNEHVNEKYLRIQFEPFGVISKVYIDREKGQALVMYDQVFGAQQAVNNMRGFNLKNTKIQVDYASRECQESFFERLEKQGAVLDRSVFDDRRDSTPAARFSRYDTPTRPRTASYSSRSGVGTASQVTQSPGTPGSATPRSRSSRHFPAAPNEYYDQDYASDRHFRNYDEYSQGSAASHDDAYEPDYGFVVHDSPRDVEIDTRSIHTSLDTVGVGYDLPEIRNLQKERVLLLEQLGECPSSGDELMTPKKRLKLDMLDPAITGDVIIEANRDHRKVMEVRRLSDTSSLKHHSSRRPSIDSSTSIKHSSLRHASSEAGYLPHAVCKRRKTGGSSDSGSIRHQHHLYEIQQHSGSESAGGSRPGTPLCDERPENLLQQPSEPRRVPRDREGPLTLPLPRFAAQVMNRGSVSVAGIKGQHHQPAQHPHHHLSSPPHTATSSPRVSHRPPSPPPFAAPPPASPPPRPPSLSSCSSDGDGTPAPPSPSLEERIRSLDERYEKWSGSRAVSAAGGDALALLDANLEKFRQRHKLLDLDLKEVQPSEIVKSVMAKRSVFDEDSKRLENFGEKYEPKEFGSFSKSTVLPTITIPTAGSTPVMTPTPPSTPLPTTPLSAPPALKIVTTLPSGILPQTPKTTTVLLSPRSSSHSIPAAKGLQYPFPTHPPLLMSPVSQSAVTSNTVPVSNSSTSTVPSTVLTTPLITTRGTNHSDSRLKLCASVPSDINRTSSKVNVNRNACKVSEKNIPGMNEQNKLIREVKSSDKTSEKVMCRRDSSSNSPRADVKTRRNSDTSARRIEDEETIYKERAQSEERKKERLEKIRVENEKLEREKQEKERIEKERVEKEKQEKERLEKETIENERLARESELEKQRLEKERLEKERIEKEQQEKEKARLEKEQHERLLKEKENQRREREKERLEQERLEKERREAERKEREEKERRLKEEREQLEKKEKFEQERRELEERERREREEREKKLREEKEHREKEEREKKLEEEKINRQHSDRERHEKERDRERKRDDERLRHKEDNHDRRKEDQKHKDHSENRHRENNKHMYDRNAKESTEKIVKETQEINRRESHESSKSSHDKSKHYSEKEVEKRRESIKENRENNIHDKHKYENNRGATESRHMSIDLDKNKTFDGVKDMSKRKERNNSLPASLGTKRRLSAHDSLDLEEVKKVKLSQEHRKLSERRDSKDSTRSEERSKSSKHKNNISKAHDKHISTKESDEKRKEKDRLRQERHKKHKLEKQKSKSKSREKESQESLGDATGFLTDKDFLARLDLRSNEDVEKQRRESKERSKETTIEDRESKEKAPEDKSRRDSLLLLEKHHFDRNPKCQSDIEGMPKSSEEKKKRDKIRKMSSDSDSDEPKKHSIFDIVDDEPAYISMYDKVKARSCKNMAKQEEEKRQEKIKAKFSQLKQSRAKREEKKRSTSYDEDSDSGKDSSDLKQKRSSKFRKWKYSSSDSDSSRRFRRTRDSSDCSDDNIKNNKLISRNNKSRITSDTSDDDYKKKSESQIKSEVFSDIENPDAITNSEEKPNFAKVKEELEQVIKKERRNSKHQESLPDINTTLYNETMSTAPDKFNSRQSFPENTSDEDNQEIAKKERSERREKKHKKKQKKQKHSVSSEESCRVDNIGDSMQLNNTEKINKHHEKKKDHNKKEKRRDKTKEGREKPKKSKKNKTDTKPDGKREGKMENIFGSLSDDSDICHKEAENFETKPDTYVEGEQLQQSTCNTEPDKEHDSKSKHREDRERDKEEHRKRKEKKRREKERRLQEAAAAVSNIEQVSNENSMDFADMGKQLEANMLRDESMEALESVDKESESGNFDLVNEKFKFNDIQETEHKKDKEDRKEGREKKKKRKKSKDEKSKHHHHHHHEKNKNKTTEKKEAPEIPEIKIEVETPVHHQNASLPTLDETSPNKSLTPDYSAISKMARETPIISPIPKTPTTSKEKKQNKFIPGFGAEVDENIHETAVKSISEFEPIVKKEEIKEEENPSDEQKLGDEKPRVVISQEETEDAVAALLGESFGNGQYDEDIGNSSDQPSNLVDENIVQDDEEMRQAVQSLSANDLDVKPDTPQSEHELQIDTDTEEADEPPLRIDPQPKTPESGDFLETEKAAEPTNYFHNNVEEKDEVIVTGTVVTVSAPSVILNSTANIGSPPSLTPIKAHSTNISEINKTVKVEQKAIPLPEMKQVSVISQSWSAEKTQNILPEPPLIKVEPQKTPSILESHQSPTKTVCAVPLRQYTNSALLKVSEPNNYPSLKPLPKQEILGQSIIENKVLAGPVSQTTSAKSPNSVQMHNLPARSPVQIAKTTTSLQDSVPGSAKITTVIHNRLPITPIMTSKPIQATPVILQQAKLPNSMEPPKLLSSLERIQERPRMLFHTSFPQFANFATNASRVVMQGNIRHIPPQGLLVPTRPLVPQHGNTLSNVPPHTYNIHPLIKEGVPIPSTEKPMNETAKIVTTAVNLVSSCIQANVSANPSHPVLPPLSIPKEINTSIPSSPRISNTPSPILLKPVSPSSKPALINTYSTTPKPPPQLPSPKSSSETTSSNVQLQSPKSTNIASTSNTSKLSSTVTVKAENISENATVSPDPITELNNTVSATVESNSNKECLKYSETSSSSVITMIPTQDVKAEEIFAKMDNEDLEESSIKLAIEKVTEELNLSLEKESPEIADKPKIQDIFKTTEEARPLMEKINPQDLATVKQECKNQSKEEEKVCNKEPNQDVNKDENKDENKDNLIVKIEEHKEETKEEIQKEKDEIKQESLEEIKEDLKELTTINKPPPLIKEIDKFEEEKTETESVISDISKERLSADILSKDDPLDTKEDSDYWSAKEVNIDSVIKTLCSADEMSDHSSETGKDDWFDDNKSTDVSKEDLESPEKKSAETTCEPSVDNTEALEPNTPSEEPVEPEEETKDVMTTRAASRGRAIKARGRGNKITRSATIDRSTIQTRRGKLKDLAAVQLPAKRNRGGKSKNERKTSKSESETCPTDIYEFRDESDENNKEHRPRLILTIKSPAVSNAQTIATVKEVTKDGAKEIGKEAVKETPQASSSTKTATKEEFTPPTPTNTRKSRRLQEKDISRTTVDDTIEDVVKNTVQTRASANQRRSPRQALSKPSPSLPETPRKSPRGGRKTRRTSEAAENSSSEEAAKDDVKPLPSPPKPVADDKEIEKEVIKPAEPVKEKPHEGLKAVVLRRIKGQMPSSQHEPTNLIDPVTGELIPMRESGEGKYIPLPDTANVESKPSNPIEHETPTITQVKPVEPPKTQPSVITTPQPITVVQQPRPQTLKSHVLSSQAAQVAIIQQQPAVDAKPANIQLPPQVITTAKTLPSVPVSKPVTTTVVTKVPVSNIANKNVAQIVISPIKIISKNKNLVITSKPSTPIVSKSITPISQHLNINTSLGIGTVTPNHLSPRSTLPVNSKLITKQVINTPVLSPVVLTNQQKQQILQVNKQQQISKSHVVTTPLVTSQLNTQMGHLKHQPLIKQQVIIGKASIVKPPHSVHQQQILTGAVPSPPLLKSQVPLTSTSRIVQAPASIASKGVMNPPKVDVSMANVMFGQRPKLSPQGAQQRLGIPVPGFEASLGEAVAHFPSGPLRPPDLNPAHYMHPNHVIYQQYLRQQQLHLTRIDKGADGQEGEEAPVTSPPLELRRPGSVGLAMGSRGVAVPHSLHSPHDRATDSPQVGQVYNVHSVRMQQQHYHPGQFYEQTEPPPAHRHSLTTHGSLAALGSSLPERPMSGHSALTAHMGTPDRPVGGHIDRPLTAHMGSISTSERTPLGSHSDTSISSHIDRPVGIIRPIGGHGDRPVGSHLDRSVPTSQVDRPISAYMGSMNAGLGAAGNLMGAVARHIGADAPATQRGIQAATPPHASQVPPQAESLLMLLKQYPCMWQGLLALKNDQAAVQMYFVSGNDDVAKCSLPKNTDGSTPPLRIFQRMRLEPPQVEGVARKMQMENEHCMLLALPCGHDHMDVLQQSKNLTNGFITYLQQKQAAGIINVAAPGTTSPPAYVVHIFPTCDFVNDNLRRIAPSLLERVADIAHLLIVITTV